MFQNKLNTVAISTYSLQNQDLSFLYPVVFYCDSFVKHWWKHLKTI